MSGFDHDAMADIDHYTTMAAGIEPMPAAEYPVLFWLRGALDEGARTLLDLGGYVGHAFRQYDRYLAFPDDFRWAVFDLPHITRAGRALAAQQPTPRLRFTNTADDSCGMDILLAAGLAAIPARTLPARTAERLAKAPAASDRPAQAAPCTALLRDDPVRDVAA
ncbi:methyltransferase, TIGR04325 family [Bosea sp. Tri-49]|uniref:methyltransferase, TIGR04325 family n=1 Tax=Bosea sp. Tri-49 TaxID=1867715 RepID=UPI001F38531C|nr:methyltransferase, TIGR04325 family [Bosea sp. Tri-49]